MGILAGIMSDLKRSAPQLVVDRNRDSWNIFGANPWAAKSATGKFVTNDTALTISALYRAVRLIADVAAGMPIHVYAKTADGRRTQLTNESERYIWGRPNPEVNRFVFWQTVIGNLVLNGNAYLYVVSVPDRPTRRPVEIYPIEPRRVRPGRTEQGEKVYVIDGTIPAKDWTAGGEIVHIQGYGTDGVKGLSIVELGAMGLGLALAAEEYAGRFFGNGSAAGGYLSSDQPLTVNQAAELSARWEELHKGPVNAHRLAVMGAGTRYLTSTLNPGDAQVIESRNYGVADVSRWTGVPEHLLGSHDKQSSWGTGIAEQNRGLLTYVIDPLLVNVELTVSDELLHRPQSHYMKFAREGLLRGSNMERAQFLEIMRRNLVINADEWREIEDMEPLPDGQGQMYVNPNTSKQEVPAGG